MTHLLLSTSHSPLDHCEGDTVGHIHTLQVQSNTGVDPVHACSDEFHMKLIVLVHTNRLEVLLTSVNRSEAVSLLAASVFSMA